MKHRGGGGTPTLRVCSWNIQRSLKDKLRIENFCNVFNDADIVFLSECWLDDADEFCVNGF